MNHTVPARGLMRTMVLEGLVDSINKRAESRELRAELCPWRGSPPRTSPPSRAPLIRSDTDLSAAGAPAASACPGPDAGGTGRGASDVCRRPGLPMRRLAGAGRAAAASGGTGGRAAALARSLRCAAGGLLLAFAALLALPPQAQAQTVETLVSNTGQTAGDQNGFVGTIAGSNWLAGQGFTTGDNTDGYTLSSVQLYIKYFDASDVANVSIYSSVSDNPGSSLYVLTSPASIVNERLNTFTARANATLEKDTEYIVVVEASGGG